MVRPKSGTPEGDRANEKWRNTMKRKYGENYHQMFVEMGRKGGEAGHTGGFYANRELASIAGKKGGKISKRTGIKNGEGKRRRRSGINE